MSCDFDYYMPKMEDDNGLELSLGLSCGTTSAKSKGKSGSSSDTRIEEGDRSSKIVDDFRNFLQPGAEKQESSVGSQRSDSGKAQDNFFNDLSKTSAEGDASVNLNGRGLWGGSNRRSAEIEEEKQSEEGSQHKLLLIEINEQKKRERDAHHADPLKRSKTSHISLTTEDGSTAENEDVADSEVVGSTSKVASHRDDGSSRFIGVNGTSEISKEVRGFPDSSFSDVQGQKRFNVFSENGLKIGNATFANPFPVQPANVLNAPYFLQMKDSNSVVTPGTSGHPQPGIVQVMPASSSERPGSQPLNSGNLPVMLGYSPVQLPVLDKDSPWGLVSHPPQIHPSLGGRIVPNSVPVQPIGRNLSEAAQYDGKAMERAKGEGKQHATEEGSSTRAEKDGKASNINLRADNAPDRATPEGLSPELSVIKPGIAAEVKFGGSGSYPNLPWVSTTGSGPHGRTISGVTYKYSANQIRIVCACHGFHMSPEDFVRHASEDPLNPESGSGLTTIPSTDPAASAQS